MKKIKWLFLFSFVLSAAIMAQHKQKENADGGYPTNRESPTTKSTYTNPVIRGDMADPTVIKTDDTYFMTATSSEWAPHYPTYESKDLINWTQVGHIFDQKPDWTSNSFWAPELYLLNGKIYCYYTARKASDGISAIGVAVADSYTDEFVDHGIIIEHEKEAIDAFVFEDNGQHYISWKAYGLDNRPIEILASKLSSDGLRLEGEPFSLLKDDEKIGMEGQAHYKIGDYYYIIYAARGCCGFNSDYDVRIARSKNLKGPYEKYEENPILYGGKNDFISIGHGTMFTTEDGRYWYLCHGYVNGDSRYLGRQPVLQELVMNDDDWLVFKNGPIAELNGSMPFEGTVQQPVQDFTDDFKNKTLTKDWTWNYHFYDVNKEIKNGKLLLSGTPTEDSHTGSVLCVKAQTPDYDYETQIIEKKNGFSGLTMYGDDKRLIAWGVENGKLSLRHVRDGSTEELFSLSKPIKKPELKIEVRNGHQLMFYYKNKNKQWAAVSNDPIDVSSLAPWDRTFRPGLIHNGKANKPAVFTYFNLKNK